MLLVAALTFDSVAHAQPPADARAALPTEPRTQPLTEPQTEPLSRAQERVLARLADAVRERSTARALAALARLREPRRGEAPIAHGRLRPIARAALGHTSDTAPASAAEGATLVAGNAVPRSAPEEPSPALVEGLHAALCAPAEPADVGLCLRLELARDSAPAPLLEWARARLRLQDRELSAGLRELAGALIADERLALADEALALASQAYPQDRELARERALLDLARGRPDQAATRLRALRARVPGESAGPLVGAYAAAGELESAATFLQERPGESAESRAARLLQRGAIALEAGDDAAARRDARAVLDATPASEHARASRRAAAQRIVALAALRQGDEEDARRTLARALREHPEDAGLRVLAASLDLSDSPPSAESD